MDDYKRSHIPAFGNWDYEDGLPITQYFESARQAGLLRYSYPEEDLYSYSATPGYFDQNDADNDLYLKPTNTTIAVVPRRKKKTKGTDEKSYQPHVKEQKRQVRVYDVEQTARQQQQQSSTLATRRVSKAVDEDLYKIPPELLYNTYPKKKKRFGFFSRCLVPSCAA
ncbi:hypothetical protein AQUCO_02500067v1 [Aquilegia coerulea]|uniref:RIN4 pathogenic type III effector avirulence factor Avr cleavage site domain-containing protein n=1 Tax=Aquilegia coerulea TaxID=218851 RepID=A0A2G5D980_AQUCA|nr:hypothetical protein AQUCO_02500067v1 [Aquilegia coerulea]